jgi:hypothetical protein
LCSYRLLI